MNSTESETIEVNEQSDLELFLNARRIESIARIPIRFRGGLDSLRDEMNGINYRPLKDRMKTYVDMCLSGNWETPERLRQRRNSGLMKLGEIPKNNKCNPWGMFFTSKRPGSGKSHFAYAVSESLIPQKTLFLANTTDLIGRIKDTYNVDSEQTELDIIDEAARAFMFLCDDIGVERPTENTLDVLYRIINERERNCRPMIFTSNCTIDELNDRLGFRIVDRIRGCCVEIKFPEISHRKV